MKYFLIGFGTCEKYDTLALAQRRKALLEELHFKGYGNRGNYTIWEAKEVV